MVPCLLVHFVGFFCGTTSIATWKCNPFHYLVFFVYLCYFQEQIKYVYIPVYLPVLAVPFITATTTQWTTTTFLYQGDVLMDHPVCMDINVYYVRKYLSIITSPNSSLY